MKNNLLIVHFCIGKLPTYFQNRFFEKYICGSFWVSYSLIISLIKWVPGISGDSVVKSKQPPWNGSSLEAVEPHPWKGAIKLSFLSYLITVLSNSSLKITSCSESKETCFVAALSCSSKNLLIKPYIKYKTSMQKIYFRKNCMANKVGDHFWTVLCGK